MIVLIVEDDPLIALALESLVTEIGTEPVVVVLVSSRADAMVEIDARLDVAILDVDVSDGKTFDVANELQLWNIPIVFVSGSNPAHLPVDLRQIPFVSKPFDEAEVRGHVTLLGGATGSVKLGPVRCTDRQTLCFPQRW